MALRLFAKTYCNLFALVQEVVTEVLLSFVLCRPCALHSCQGSFYVSKWSLNFSTLSVQDNIAPFRGNGRNRHHASAAT